MVIVSNMYLDKGNRDIVNSLCNLTYSTFIEQLSKTDSKELDDEEYWNIEQYKIITNLAKKLKQNNYCLKQSYKHASNRNDGRKFLDGLGIQKLNRYYRGPLCDGIYTDVDMVNCHMVALQYLCSEFNIECYALNKYCNNRDSIINTIISDNDFLDRGAVKTLLFIKSLNCCDKVRGIYIDKKFKKINSSFFEEFDNEIKKIQSIFLKKYPNDLAEIKKQHAYKNIAGRLMARILQKFEAKIIDDVKANNFQVNVDMFDGFQTFDKVDDKYIDRLNQLTKKNKMKWDTKEHNLLLKYDILAIEEQSKKFIYAENIPKLAEKICEDYLKDILFFVSTKHYYVNEGVIDSNLTSIKKDLYKFITSNEVVYKHGDKTIIVSSIKSQIDDLINSLLNECKRYDNNYFDSIETNTKDKMLFKNGYYDFKSNKFIKNFKGIQSFIRVNRDFDEQWNEKINQQILDKVFYPIFGIKDLEADKIQLQLMQYFLQRIARTIAGKVEDKKFLILKGLRDCGKGVITYGFNCAFENYLYPIQLKSFFNTMTQGDQAKNNSFMLDFRFRRLAIGQEIKMSEKEFIDGSIIKQFCSGGDEMVARKNFQDETKFKIQSGLLFCVNDMLNIKPLDTYEKCDVFDLTSKFVPPDYPDSKKLNGVNYYPADDTIKQWLETPAVRNQMILLLLKYFKCDPLVYPQCLKDDADEINDNANSYIDVVREMFEQGTPDDILISNSELKRILSDSDLQMSLPKFKKTIGQVFDNVNLMARTNKIRGITGVRSLNY